MKVSTSSSGQAGFTLVELMVVLVIIGVLAGAATVVIDPSPSVADRAKGVALLVRAASRHAVAEGPVRANVAAAESTARTRITLSTDNGMQVLEVRRKVEDPDASSAAFTWEDPPLATLALGDKVELVGVNFDADAGSGETNPPALAPDYALDCFPDGTCSAQTLYLAESNAARSKPSRVVVFPLNGIPAVFRGW